MYIFSSLIKHQQHIVQAGKPLSGDGESLAIHIDIGNQAANRCPAGAEVSEFTRFEAIEIGPAGAGHFAISEGNHVECCGAKVEEPACTLGKIPGGEGRGGQPVGGGDGKRVFHRMLQSGPLGVVPPDENRAFGEDFLHGGEDVANAMRFAGEAVAEFARHGDGDGATVGQADEDFHQPAGQLLRLLPEGEGEGDRLPRGVRRFQVRPANIEPQYLWDVPRHLWHNRYLSRSGELSLNTSEWMVKTNGVGYKIIANMNIIEGQLVGSSGRFALVASRFNQLIVDKLIEGAEDAFTRHGVSDEMLDLVWVPGAFELPLVAQRLAESGKYAAVVCLGCVIQGETDHYDYVCGQTASGIARASQETGVPVIFGVLTCDTLEQAMNRSGGKAGNKGSDSALAALEMASVLEQLPEGE